MQLIALHDVQKLTNLLYANQGYGSLHLLGHASFHHLPRRTINWVRYDHPVARSNARKAYILICLFVWLRLATELPAWLSRAYIGHKLPVAVASVEMKYKEGLRGYGIYM